MYRKNTWSTRRSRFLFCACFLSLLPGCANTRGAGSDQNVYDGSNETPSVVSYENYRDPLEPVNRVTFKFNDLTFRYALSPLARGYQKVTPDVVEKHIGNVFNNVGEPLDSLNNLLQGKFKQSGASILRFLINSTIGIAGVFDVADFAWRIEENPNSFDDTFAYYGMGSGVYVVMPFLGPSDLRAGGSVLVELALHPIGLIEHEGTRRVVRYFNYFQGRASTLSNYPAVVADTDDPYIFTRNLYWQGSQRDAEQIRSAGDDQQPQEPPPDERPPPREPTPPDPAPRDPPSQNSEQ